jgi:hypothetical protein
MPNRGGNHFRTIVQPMFDTLATTRRALGSMMTSLIADNHIVIALVAANHRRKPRRKLLQLDLLWHGSTDREREVDALPPASSFAGEVRQIGNIARHGCLLRKKRQSLLRRSAMCFHPASAFHCCANLLDQRQHAH